MAQKRTRSRLQVSIVIPVYNEAEHLAACLTAISQQDEAPLEVIVVDNNSTDDTANIIRHFSFVRLLTEPRQGVVHARNRGFDAARGDIIGRIDADTLLPADWTRQLRRIFEREALDAVSGSAHYYDFALAGIADAIDVRCRNYLARQLKQNNYLWGANMGLRRSAWQRVRPLLCDHRHLHEDFDLAIHLQELGHRVDFNDRLRVGVSSRRINSSFLAYVRYTLVSPRTYARHALKSRRHMYPVLLLCWVSYVPGRLVYRSYNPETGNFSLTQLLSASAARVDPTANVA